MCLEAHASASFMQNYKFFLYYACLFIFIVSILIVFITFFYSYSF